MGERHIKAKKLYWQQFTEKERADIMRLRALKMWSKKSLAERKKASLRMEKARLAKLKVH